MSTTDPYWRDSPPEDWPCGIPECMCWMRDRSSWSSEDYRQAIAKLVHGQDSTYNDLCSIGPLYEQVIWELLAEISPPVGGRRQRRTNP